MRPAWAAGKWELAGAASKHGWRAHRPQREGDQRAAVQLGPQISSQSCCAAAQRLPCSQSPAAKGGPGTSTAPAHDNSFQNLLWDAYPHTPLPTALAPARGWAPRSASQWCWWAGRGCPAGPPQQPRGSPARAPVWGARGGGDVILLELPRSTSCPVHARQPLSSNHAARNVPQPQPGQRRGPRKPSALAMWLAKNWARRRRRWRSNGGRRQMKGGTKPPGERDHHVNPTHETNACKRETCTPKRKGRRRREDKRQRARESGRPPVAPAAQTCRRAEPWRARSSTWSRPAGRCAGPRPAGAGRLVTC